MHNQEIARVLDEIADLLEIQGENFFRVRAYRNAARSIRDHPVQLTELAPEQLREVPGIGADLADKLTTLMRTGELPLHKELTQKVPHGLLELRQIPGLGPKRVRILAEHLGIHDRTGLKRAAEAGALRKIHGFGRKIEERILQSLAEEERAPANRLLYPEAAGMAESLLAHLRKSAAVKRLEVAGSLRRKRETVGDLDVLATSPKPKLVMKQLLSYPSIAQTLGSGETKSTVVLKGGFQVDLRVVPQESYGAAMVYFTGSKAHGVHLRRIAQAKGLLLNEYGLFRGNKAIAGKDEEDIYRVLGLQWIAPELREDRGEVEAAAAGKLPALLQRADLRGDLHTHSKYTDGRASIEDMARTARDNGLEYFAVTDHSRRVTMAHGLDPARLRQQWREIERVAARVKGIKLLRGIEVDVLDDGSLDLPDETLAELDWVVASVHYKLNQDASDMTRRIVKAIRNRNVDVLGHPSGRLLSHRPPSNFDLAEVLRVAHGEGCALEINSQPERLDLTDTSCMAAKRAGLKLVVSSDSHHPHDFTLLQYGVNQARRGWIEPTDVLNTRPLAKMRQRRPLASVG
jgi:DNA polymerase (family X)